MDNYQDETIQVSELKELLKEASERCTNEGEAIIVGVDGAEDMVLLPFENFQMMQSRLELLELLINAEADVMNGRTESFDEVIERLREELEEELDEDF